MEKKSIIKAMEEGMLISEMSEAAALTFLNNKIAEVYIINGLHRQVQPDKFNEEVRFCATALYKDILSDAKYSRLHDSEIGYIFSEGLKGRLGTDKDIVITCKSLLRWIEGYVTHFEYKEARREYLDSRRPVPKALPRREWTDDDYRRIVREAYEEYKSYRESLSCDTLPNPDVVPGIKSVGELMGRKSGAPASLADFGKVRTSWLVSKGYAKEGERLVDVFARVMANGDKFERVL